MKTGQMTTTVQIVGSNDGSQTFEVRRTWDETKKKGLIIELYPTISVEDIDRMDLSTMHLMNHANELGWGSTRILNLYSTVFETKPSTSKLLEEKDNMDYLKTVFSQKDITEYDIVIAWGSGLSNHLPTIRKKIEILEMLRKKKLSKNVMCIEAEYMDVQTQGVHPLFLGLHHAKEQWCLQSFSVEDAIGTLASALEKSASKKTSLRVVEKGEGNVLQD